MDNPIFTCLLRVHKTAVVPSKSS